MIYDAKQISKELLSTAMGEAYHWNAHRVAKDVPGITAEERQVLAPAP